MKKILPLFAGIALLAGVSAANAGEPVQLTTAQMDKVVAGAIDRNTITQNTAQLAVAAAAGGFVNTATAVNTSVQVANIIDVNAVRVGRR